MSKTVNYNPSDFNEILSNLSKNIDQLSSSKSGLSSLQNYGDIGLGDYIFKKYSKNDGSYSNAVSNLNAYKDWLDNSNQFAMEAKKKCETIASNLKKGGANTNVGAGNKGSKTYQGKIVSKDGDTGDSASQEQTVTRTSYTVTFDGNGAPSRTVEVMPNEKVARPNDPSKNGSVFVDWYCNGKVYDFNANVTQDLVLKATWELSPTIINYKQSNPGSGIWIFINNPERIRDKYLVNQSNEGFFYGNIIGDVEVYYEHMVHEQSCPKKIYYAFRFYNSNSFPVTLSIEKQGHSTIEGQFKNGRSYKDTWRKYFKENHACQYTINAGGVLVLYHDDPAFTTVPTESSAISPGYCFDGVVKMNASGSLGFLVMAFDSTATETETAYQIATRRERNEQKWITYSGMVEEIILKQDPENVTILEEKNGYDSYGVFTGYTKQSPDVYNNAVFKVNDLVSSGSRLPVIIQPNTESTTQWITNLISLKDPSINLKDFVKRDIMRLVLKSPTSEVFTLDPNGIDPRSMTDIYRTSRPYNACGYNVGNWAVHYHENFTVTNEGSKNRVLSFHVDSLVVDGNRSTFAQCIVAIPSMGGNEIFAYTKQDTQNLENTVWKVALKPGETKQIDTMVLLGGMSDGGFIKYIYVDE